MPHCVGIIRGHQVTGPGELASHEVIQGTRRGGQGISTFTLRVPTAGGVQEIRDVAPFTFTGTVGVGHGRMLAEDVILVLAALEGDCVTEPVRKIGYLDTFRIYTGG